MPTDGIRNNSAVIAQFRVGNAALHCAKEFGRLEGKTALVVKRGMRLRLLKYFLNVNVRQLHGTDFLHTWLPIRSASVWFC